VDSVLGEIAGAPFVDGRETAPGSLKEVKNNLQIGRGQRLPEAERLIRQALDAHAEFAAFAQPAAILSPVYSRYEPGMEYGPHVDAAIIGAPRIRADLSLTLFLSPPESYDGGELVVDSLGARHAVKLDAGEAVVYPAGSIHHVAPVTRGVRLAAVTWIQSLVPNESLRGILFDLWQASQRPSVRANPDLSLIMSRIYQNLIRHAAGLG
jgi:PKHD-type hydroxylase